MKEIVVFINGNYRTGGTLSPFAGASVTLVLVNFGFTQMN